MIFVDYDNFRSSLTHLHHTRQAKVSRLADFIMQYIGVKMGYEKYNPELIRTYVYTGEYADTTIQRIKSHRDTENKKEKKEKIIKLLGDIERRSDGQRKFFENAIQFDFLELRVKPLQYSPQGIKVFQKGVDVQIAVDLLANAYRNNYDVAVLCSGDVDLLESIKMVKDLGKKIIIMCHKNLMSKNIRKNADHVILMEELGVDEIEKFSYLPAVGGNQFMTNTSS
ncbi:MAG: NYN domain-containing protein [archaeon]